MIASPARRLALLHHPSPLRFIIYRASVTPLRSAYPDCNTVECRKSMQQCTSSSAFFQPLVPAPQLFCGTGQYRIKKGFSQIFFTFIPNSSLFIKKKVKLMNQDISCMFLLARLGCVILQQRRKQTKLFLLNKELSCIVVRQKH